jgi:hypothetical protein
MVGLSCCSCSSSESSRLSLSVRSSPPSSSALLCWCMQQSQVPFSAHASKWGSWWLRCLFSLLCRCRECFARACGLCVVCRTVVPFLLLTPMPACKQVQPQPVLQLRQLHWMLGVWTCELEHSRISLNQQASLQVLSLECGGGEAGRTSIPYGWRGPLHSSSACHHKRHTVYPPLKPCVRPLVGRCGSPLRSRHVLSTPASVPHSSGSRPNTRTLLQVTPPFHIKLLTTFCVLPAHRISGAKFDVDGKQYRLLV